MKLKVDVITRAATSADIGGVTDVFLRARKELMPFAPLAHTDYDVCRWIADWLIPTGRVTVAVGAHGLIVGMAATSEADGVLWLDQLYVFPPRVGQGIGTRLLTDRGVTSGTLAVEFRSLPLKVSLELRRLLPGLTQQDGWPLLNELRKVKSPAEVEVMTRANRLTAESLEKVLGSVRPGLSEREIGAQLAEELWSRGADELSHSVLGAGPRAASWHPWPTGQGLEDGMLIRSDWGVRIDGYTSDIARNAVVGRASAGQKDTFARISEVHDTLVAAVKPGVLASDLSAIARREYARVGLEYRWGLVGHGIGMVIHEEPQLLLDVHDPVVEGMTLEIELGYFGETGGYHIEDMVHVTASGAVNLTQRDPNRRLIESGR